MAKVAIYARVSKADKSRPSASLDVQIEECRKLAREHGFAVADVFKDDGISRTENNRPAYQELLAAMEEGDFDGVLVYDQDRFSGSDDGEFLRVTAALSYRDQFLIDRHGYDSRTEYGPLLAALKSGVSSLEVVKLRRRTRDALRKRASDGYCAGGVPYGYRTQRTDNGFRELVKCDEEVGVVVSIYEMAADGMSTRAIAGELNARGVPSSGRRKVRRKWMHTTVRGILRNPVYVGDLIWNRFRVKRRPGSSKKERHPVPESEWVRVHREELRIIDKRLWSRVRGRIEETAEETARLRAAGKNTGGRRYSRLLSGLLKCDKCGFAYVIADAHSYACASHRSGGVHACANSIRVKRTFAEDKILQAVRDQLLTGDVVQRMRRHMQQLVRERKRLAAKDNDHVRLTADLRRIEQRVGNVVAAMTDGALRSSPALAAQLKQLESEQVRLRKQIDATTAGGALDALPDIIPQAVERYRAEVDKMGQMGDEPDPRDVIAAREWLRGNLGDIRLAPHRDGYLIAHIALQERAVALAAGDACYRVRPGQDLNL